MKKKPKTPKTPNQPETKEQKKNYTWDDLSAAFDDMCRNGATVEKIF